MLDALGRVFRLRNEAIGHRVGVAPAIGPERRDGLTVKHMTKDIRGFEADPGQAVHLKTSGFDIPIKGAPVVAVNRNVYANLLDIDPFPAPAEGVEEDESPPEAGLKLADIS